MTWSIVARDPSTGALAVAVTTCNLAVGAACPFLRTGVGAVSTQSMSNRYLGPAVLEALARGLSPRLALDSALAGDEGRGLRKDARHGDGEGALGARLGLAPRAPRRIQRVLRCDLARREEGVRRCVRGSGQGGGRREVRIE